MPGSRTEGYHHLEVANRSRQLLWIRTCLVLFIAGLLVSGITAIPLVQEVSFLHKVVHSRAIFGTEIREWVQAVYAALLNTQAQYPFLFYGAVWLAFGHFVIALAFLGPLRDPIRNIWVIHFGMIACVLVIPFALIFGALRQIPWWWRLIDCAFGISGLIPLWFARRWTIQLASRMTRE